MNTATDTEEIVRRILNNTSSPEEKERLLEYFNQYGLTEDGLEEAFWHYPADEQSMRMRQAVMSAMETGHSRKLLKLPAISKYIRHAAAVLIPLIALATVFIYFNNSGRNEKTALTRIENTAQTVRYIRLSDSSEIWLNKGASITLNEQDFAANRHITLNGEAFFQVAQDPRHPFSVKAGPLLTQVLGTSFSIRADPADDRTIVALISGKVQVTEGNNSRILIPGESVVYDHHKGSLQTSALPFSFLAWKTKKLTCNKEPLSNIIQYLNTYYDRSIRLRPGLEGSTYSGSLTLESDLSTVLNRLLFVHQLHYKISGNEILIY